MNIKSSKVWPLLASLGLIMSVVMCTPTVDEVTPTPTLTPTSAPEPTATPTPTLTPTPQAPEPAAPPTATPMVLPPPAGDTPTLTVFPSPTPTSSPSPCADLSGAIEVQVLVGPADAAGLEPFAVGSVPFTVAGGIVQGAGPITYQDILIEDWGTYAVTLDLDITISGECVEAGLNVTLDLAGSQYVEVEAEGFHGEYPWQGEHSFQLSFPLEDGATVQGEGWAFVLRLHSQ